MQFDPNVAGRLAKALNGRLESEGVVPRRPRRAFGGVEAATRRHVQQEIRHPRTIFGSLLALLDEQAEQERCQRAKQGPQSRGGEISPVHEWSVERAIVTQGITAYETRPSPPLLLAIPEMRSLADGAQAVAN